MAPFSIIPVFQHSTKLRDLGNKDSKPKNESYGFLEIGLTYAKDNHEIKEESPIENISSKTFDVNSQTDPKSLNKELEQIIGKSKWSWDIGC